MVTESRFVEVYSNNPDVDRILSPNVLKIRQFRPDLLINLHGGTRSLMLTALSGARRTAGFEHHRASWLYDRRIPTAQEILGVSRTVHTAEHVASALFWLGVPQSEIPRARLFASPLRRAEPYAVLHPFAAAPAKQWPPDRFVELARKLDVSPVFIGSSQDDFTPFREFEVLRGSLTETSGLIAGASLFIGNDSGPAHMAAAHGIPSIVLFGTSDSVIWGPWRTEARVLKHPDISQIRVEEVQRAVDAMGVRG